MYAPNQAHLPTFLQTVAAKGQLPNHIAGKVLPQVKITRPVINVAFGVGEVSRLEASRLPIGADGVISGVVGAVVQTFGVGVRSPKLQIVTKCAVQRHLQGIVVRGTDCKAHNDIAEIRIRRSAWDAWVADDRAIGKNLGRQAGVGFLSNKQMVGLRTNVT